MKTKFYSFILFLIILTIFNLDCSTALGAHPPNLPNWKAKEVLQATERKPARTAVLILSPPELKSYTPRWAIGRKAWEQYMTSHPNVDCFFIQTTCPDPKRGDEQVWLEGNTIYVGDQWYQDRKSDRILHKTIAALEWLLPDYTHYFRTNLNVFLNLNCVNEYMETHHQSHYTTPICQEAWYTIGYAIVFTADVAKHIVNEYRRLESIGEELISPNHADDGAITALATGVWPYKKPYHPFTCCPSLPYGIHQLMSHDSFPKQRINHYGVLLTPPITFDTAMEYCELAGNNKMIYRTNGGLNMNELAQLYSYLIEKHYPNLPCEDLVKYFNLK